MISICGLMDMKSLGSPGLGLAIRIMVVSFASRILVNDSYCTMFPNSYVANRRNILSYHTQFRIRELCLKF